MILLDAYALVALLVDEPAGPEVERLLRQGESAVVIVNLAEAIDVSQRVHGIPPDEVRAALEPLLLDGALVGVVSEGSHAWLAADLRARHYDRKTRALSLADCFLLAHALTTEDEIASSDPSLAEAARSEGVAIIGLPDSSGVRP